MFRSAADVPLLVGIVADLEMSHRRIGEMMLTRDEHKGCN